VRLPAFELHEPRSLEETLALLGRLEGDVRVAAGGTALLSMVRMGLLRPDHVVTLHRVPGLDALGAREGTLQAGALVTLARLARAAEVRRDWPLLADAAAAVATPAIRSAATVGGSLAYAEAASDLAPALLCLEAEVEVAGPGGRRRIPVAAWHVDFYATALAAGELVVGLRVPPPVPGTRGGYVKYSARSAEDRALVGVAALLVPDGAVAGAWRVRLGLGGVAPTPLRARRAEARLDGGALDDVAIGEAAVTAAAECAPLDDLMGSADYRREMVRVWVARLLAALRDGRPAPRP
jgi:carbon-monoxide dehydrogenase medium subunit